jgi:methionyl-tRNA formyltransferase
VTGFSYHFMEEGIDMGFVLLQGAIPIPLKAKNHELVQAKIRLAAKLMPQVLDALARGDPGRPQTGVPSYFGAHDGRRITVINDPSALSWEELERRLRAFTVLTISIDGESYKVTRLRRIGSGRPHRPELAFTTLDGVLAEPSRCSNLPVSIYRAYWRARRVRNCN